MFIRGLLISLMILAGSFAQAQSACESAAARVKASSDGQQDSQDIRDIEKQTVESTATEEAFDKVLANPTGTVKTQNSDLKNAAVIISNSTQQALDQLQPLVDKCKQACVGPGETDKCDAGQDRLDKYAAEKARADDLAAKGDDYEDQTGGKSGKDSSANGDQKNQGQAGQGGGSPGGGGGSPSSPTSQSNQASTPPPTCDNGLSTDPVCQKQASMPPEIFLPVSKPDDTSSSGTGGTSAAENRKAQFNDGTAGQAVGSAAAGMSGGGGGSGSVGASSGAAERGGGGPVRNGTDQEALRALAVNAGSTGGSGGGSSGSSHSSIASGGAGHAVGSALTNSVVGRMKAMATSLRRGPAGLPGRDGITASLGPDLWRKVRVRYSESRLIP